MLAKQGRAAQVCPAGVSHKQQPPTITQVLTDVQILQQLQQF